MVGHSVPAGRNLNMRSSMALHAHQVFATQPGRVCRLCEDGHLLRKGTHSGDVQESLY